MNCFINSVVVHIKCGGGGNTCLLEGIQRCDTTNGD